MKQNQSVLNRTLPVSRIHSRATGHAKNQEEGLSVQGRHVSPGCGQSIFTHTDPKRHGCHGLVPRRTGKQRAQVAVLGWGLPEDMGPGRCCGPLESPHAPTVWEDPGVLDMLCRHVRSPQAPTGAVPQMPSQDEKKERKAAGEIREHSWWMKRQERPADREKGEKPNQVCY